MLHVRRRENRRIPSVIGRLVRNTRDLEEHSTSRGRGNCDLIRWRLDFSQMKSCRVRKAAGQLVVEGRQDKRVATASGITAETAVASGGVQEVASERARGIVAVRG